MTDARFEDGAEHPLRLAAQDGDDLRVISALVQDAILTGADFTWQPRRRRFAVLLNRFRWEARGQGAERVRSLLVIDGALRAARQGIERDRDTVLSLLTLDWQPQAEGAGRLMLVFAGDGAVALEVECLDVSLTDVTRPYAAPAGRAPGHPD